MKFTKKSIEALSLPLADKPYYKIFRDDAAKGFAIRVTSEGTKTFILDKKIHNKLVRVTIGRFGDLTVDEARKEYQKLLAQYVTGHDPAKEVRAKRHQSGITLAKVLSDYVSLRKDIKAETKAEYQSVVKDKFSNWYNKPLGYITKEKVVRRHAEIGKKSQSAADKAFKILSALFNFAIVNYDNEDGDSVIKDNPVIRLSQIRAWYPKRRRQRKIESDQLPTWFKAVNKLHNTSAQSIADSVKHYLLLLLFTGIRRDEAMRLIWVEYKSKDEKIAKHQRTLDLKKKLIHIPDPKNKQEFWLPLPDYLVQLFKEHKEKTSSKYVLPNAKGNHHIIEPKKVIQQVIKTSGVEFSSHDLRRTFATISESLDISAYALKRLLNHKIAHSDVTAGYIVTDIERLRSPIEKIADYILEKVK